MYQINTKCIMSYLVLKEIHSILKTKIPTKEQIKNTK